MKRRLAVDVAACVLLLVQSCGPSWPDRAARREPQDRVQRRLLAARTWRQSSSGSSRSSLARSWPDTIWAKSWLHAWN
jgi:hypothetical protein